MLFNPSSFSLGTSSLPLVLQDVECRAVFLTLRCFPRHCQGSNIRGIIVLVICQEEECVLYMGLKCPCCSEKGDSQKKTKLVPFAAAKFPFHCCVQARRCPELDHIGWFHAASVAKQMALVIKSPVSSGRCLASWEGHGALL